MDFSAFQTFFQFVSGVFFFLIGLVWRGLERRLSQLEGKVDSDHFTKIQTDLSAIKTDLEWVKKVLYPKHEK